jgi:hypothetical protein
MWAVVIAIIFMCVDEVIFMFLALLQTMQILFKGWQNNDHWVFFRITVNRQTIWYFLHFVLLAIALIASITNSLYKFTTYFLPN